MRMSLALSAMPSAIPIFPLEGALLLPGARLPLNIFEPRYLAMVDDALRSDLRLIGMVQPYTPPQSLSGDGPGPDERRSDKHDGDASLYKIGCAGRITNFSETEDGRYMIVLTGLSRFRTGEEIEGFTPFRRMNVDWTPFEADLAHAGYEVDEETHHSFIKLAERYFAASDLSADWDALEQADHETLMNAIAMLCPFSPQEKQALLEAPSMEDRERDLRALMEFVVADPDAGGDLQ